MHVRFRHALAARLQLGRHMVEAQLEEHACPMPPGMDILSARICSASPKRRASSIYRYHQAGASLKLQRPRIYPGAIAMTMPEKTCY